MSVTRMLLVDDDQQLCALLKTKLEKTGRFSVDYVLDPLEAHNRAKALGPHNLDVFILDVDMPEMSGGELASLLSEDPAFTEIPVIFLTSLVRPEETEEAQQGFRFPVLSKGITIRELVQAIEDTLGKMDPV